MPFDLADTMRSWRRHLHQHPELSREEQNTAAFVCARLAEMGVAYEPGVGGHGVVASISKGASNRAVGLRADMDALPIAEATGLEYASANPGVMHACGHDGHTASLLGAARLLQDDASWAGTVRFVFQPAEEGFGGAQAMLDDGLLQRFPMERIFGYHNWPGLAAGTVMLHRGPLMAACARLAITVSGHAGHAAMPHLTADPVQAAAHIIVALNTIVARNTNPLDAAVVSIATMHAGKAMNQIPEHATLTGTIRAMTSPALDALQERIREVASLTALALGTTAEVTVDGLLAPTINDDAAGDIAAEAAAASGYTLRRDLAPTMGAEDFGCFLQAIPGAYAWIGNGEASRGLHHPEFDYNDDILPTAAGFLAATAKAALTA